LKAGNWRKRKPFLNQEREFSISSVRAANRSSLRDPVKTDMTKIGAINLNLLLRAMP
jgi:hypothetical protein